MKGVFILGATGSIGENALKVLQQNSSEFSLTGISFFKNVDKACEISQKFRPKYIFNKCIVNFNMYWINQIFIFG